VDKWKCVHMDRMTYSFISLIVLTNVITQGDPTIMEYKYMSSLSIYKSIKLDSTFNLKPINIFMICFVQTYTLDTEIFSERPSNSGNSYHEASLCVMDLQNPRSRLL
jgi:hypothetical protein